MKRIPIFLSVAMALVGTLQADPYVHDDGLNIQVENGIGSLKWTGTDKRVYFIQTPGDDLGNPWEYLLVIEQGQGTEISWGFSGDADAFWLRLAYSDVPVDDPFTGDSDLDSVSNWDELLAGLDPLSWTDTDLDGLADDWEIFHFGNLSQDASGNDDSDTLNNKDEYDLALDPNVDQASQAGSRLNYTYDAVGRLTSATGPEISVSFSHDEEGNILSSN